MLELLLVNANGLHIPMEDESVHVTITSPPYYGLRHYPVEPVLWPAVEYAPMVGLPPLVIAGCDLDCEHEWKRDSLTHVRGKVGDHSTLGGGLMASGEGRVEKIGHGQFCSRCGGWRGHLGNEPNIEMYVGHLVLIFREVKRVLRLDGTFWLNLGDSYAGSNKGVWSGGSAAGPKQATNKGSVGLVVQDWDQVGLKAKNLMGIPWRVALALQADGWWLRSAPPWLKSNQLPESVQDRPTRSHEYWFMLTKSERYYYDTEAVRVAYTGPINRWGGVVGGQDTVKTQGYRAEIGGVGGSSCLRPGSNLRPDPTGRQWRTTDPFQESLDFLIDRWVGYLDSVRAFVAGLQAVREDRGLLLGRAGDPLAVMFPTKGYPGAHFATYTPEMIAPLILASTSDYGVCPKCGAPWERVVSKAGVTARQKMEAKGQSGYASAQPVRPQGLDYAGSHNSNKRKVTTIGWQPTCTCFTEPVKGMVTCPKCNGAGEETIFPRGGQGWSGGSGIGIDDGERRDNSGGFDGISEIATGESCPKCDGAGEVEGDVWLTADDLEIIHTPTGERVGNDPTMETGRAGYNRPRGGDEGTRPMTRYEQRCYARQLRGAPHRAEMAAEAGAAFDHYVRTDRSGARPVPPDLLEVWIERGWLEPAPMPSYAMPLEDIPTAAPIVYDPFVGSGSTLVAAMGLFRWGVGSDLSFDYLRDHARPRLAIDALAAWLGERKVEEEEPMWDELPLFRSLGGEE
jgi:hypothetical protein